MNLVAYRILRIGMGITFVYIGILIWQSPLSWGSFIQPWALKFLHFPLEQTMKVSAVFDVVIGAWLFFGTWARIAAFLAAAHLAVILVTTTGSFTSIIVRDIGLLAGCLALSVGSSREY